MVLASILLFAATSPLSSANDYIFAPFRSKADAAHWIEGRIMGVSGDYRILRAEDVAYLDEAWAERKALYDGSIPANQFNVVTNRVLRSTQFTFSYGRWATVPGYIREGPTLQSGIYRIENNAQLSERIAKLNGEWCTLSNVYWRVNYSNELANPLMVSNIVRNFKLLALAERMEKEGLSRTNRKDGGYTYSINDYNNYSQNGYPDSYDWENYHPTPYENTYTWYGSAEYSCNVSASKGAQVGAVRTDDGWEYALSPPETTYYKSESVHTGEGARVCFDLGIQSKIITTGGVRRISSARLYIPLSLSYSRNRGKYVTEGYKEIVNTNVSARFVYTLDAQVTTTATTARAEFDFNGKSVAESCLSAIGMPSPSALTASQLDEPSMYTDDSHYATSDQEYRSVEISISGNAVAIMPCTFKTAPP